MYKKLIAIVGTNASGKSSLGLKLAKEFGAEIVSADSRQVYKHLDLGTGKVSVKELQEVPHHLINILELNQPFSLAEYQERAYQAIDSICARGSLPFLVGGTGLYTRAVIEGYNLVSAPPNYQLRAELADKSANELRTILKERGDNAVPNTQNIRHLVRRIEKLKSGSAEDKESTPRYNTLQLGLTWDRAILHKRIEERLDARLAQGMVEEVQKVLKMGATPEFLEDLGLEYRLTYRYIKGNYDSFQAYRDDLFTQIRRFAKRQMTWFRKEKNIIWLDSTSDYYTQAKQLISNFLAK